MLFRVYNIKWRDGITTVTPDEMYIPVWDKNYDDAAESAKKHMAVWVRNAVEWTEDRSYWDLRLMEEYGIPGILGSTSANLTHCVQQMQELLLLIDATDEKNKHVIRMTHIIIKTTADLLKKVQNATPVYINTVK